MEYQCKKCDNTTSIPYEHCPNCGRKNPIYKACIAITIADYVFNEMIMQSKIAAH